MGWRRHYGMTSVDAEKVPISPQVAATASGVMT
jgi:hypothetical protein